MKGLIIDPSATTRSILLDELDYPSIEWNEFESPNLIPNWDSLDVEIIITAMEFGNSTGLELVSDIRKQIIHQPIAILVTSHTDGKFVIQAYEMGVDLVVSKKRLHGGLKKLLNRVIPAAPKPKKILLVDDSTISRKVTLHSLTKKGFEVMESSSAEEALNLLKVNSGKILLVISDENMEGMNGTDLCLKMRRTPEYALIPFFISSADESLKQTGVDYHSDSKFSLVNGYFPKPTDPNCVERIVNFYSEKWYSYRNDLRIVLPPRPILVS